MNSSNIWRDLRVGTKITIIPVFFISALLAILYFTVTTLKNQENDLMIMELVGRQRMLQQAQFATALLVADNQADQASLKYLRDVWLQTQQALLNGGPAPERLYSDEKLMLAKAPTLELRNLLIKQSEFIAASIADSDKLLVTPQGTPEYSQLVSNLLSLQRQMQDLGVHRAYTNYMRDQANSLVQKQIGIAIFVGVTALFLSWIITRGITVPLQQVVDAARHVASGNLKANKLSLKSQDEIGQLSQAFDHMLDNLKDLTAKILAVTGNVSAAAAEILASTQQQASSTKEQAATVQEISTTMQEITQSGAEISEKAKQVAASAEATSAVSHSGITAVQNASRLMEGIRQQVEEVATKIVSLSERTQTIGEIVRTVNDIAEQSNLLALNASIEAASAGEQGSRFSVVASEMKNLAERAKESTVQVGGILGEIQRGINSSVMMAEEAVKRTDSGKQQAEVTERTIHQMTQTTIDSVNAFQQIIGATGQQQIGFDQVTQGMRDIRQAAEQTAIGTAQLEKALANLNELSGELRSAVSRYQL